MDMDDDMSDEEEEDFPEIQMDELLEHFDDMGIADGEEVQ
jgi:nonsense-mediated mRNA decay protein 3